MLIRESTLRRIIREEAARVMNEQPAPTASGAAAAPVIATGATVGALEGPKDPAKIAAAKAKYEAAADALTYAVTNLEYIYSLKTALTYRTRSPGDPKFAMISKIVENGLTRAARDTYGAPAPLQTALVLLAVGEVTAKGKDPLDRGYIFAGDTVLGHFIPKYSSSGLDNIETWRQSGTVNDKVANKFVETVRPIASKIVATWNALATAMREYNNVVTQPGIGTALSPAPVGVSQYTVVRGDLVSYIAQRFYGSVPSNLRLAFYKTLTNGADPNRIEVGQKLSLPNVVTTGGKDYKLNRAAPAITYAMGKVA